MFDIYKSKIYPIFAIILNIYIVVIGLLLAKRIEAFYFLGGCYIIFIIIGCYKAALKVLPISVILFGIFFGINYAVTQNLESSLALGERILSFTIAVIPTLSIRPIDLVRNMNSLKVPRIITLGMLIALNFIPLLMLEMKQIREAMKIRGAGFLFNPKVFYRAHLVPLITRIVEISDTLSLSIETRGFSTSSKDYSIYHKPKINIIDILVFILILGGGIVGIIL